ncbi:unnamed protein product [Linum trigynum]|uniref:Uncharacterized protein n=1 Tax=Linum trigynum TaxID=586398 RepID=A0AAV2DDM0_9ROSI
MECSLRERQAELVGERDKFHAEVEWLRTEARKISEELKRTRKSKEQYKKDMKASLAGTKRLKKDLAEYVMNSTRSNQARMSSILRR